jgi:hypothetical protein
MPHTIQTLNARYIDGAALLALLVRLFGRGNFKIDVCSWQARPLIAPREKV